MSRDADIERLLRRRDIIIIASAGGFLVWQGGWLLTDLVPAGPAMTGAVILTVLGFLAWVAATAGLMLYYRSVRQAGAEAELDDELARHRQDRAFLIGYWCLAGSLAAMLGLEGFFDIDPAIYLRTLILIGVLTPLLAFLWLDRDEGGAE